jgi:hypothetical protein
VGCFIARDRLRHLVERGGREPAIDGAEVNRRRIVWRGRTGRVADLLGIGWPIDRERLRAPHCLEQSPVGPLRGAVRGTGDIGQTHLDRIRRRSFSLFGGGITEAASGRAHVPEVSADQIALLFVVVKYRRQRRVAVRLRLAVAESGSDRTGVRAGGLVELRDRPCKSGFGHVAEGARFVAVHRKLLVEEHQLAQQFHLLHLVVGRRPDTTEHLCFDSIDLSLDLCDLPQRTRRKRQRVSSQRRSHA